MRPNGSSAEAEEAPKRGRPRSRRGSVPEASARTGRPANGLSGQGSHGSDVIAFAEAINREVTAEFFGEGSARNSARALLIAAIESFSEKGFHVTTTRDIARRAGMSPAALYVHFRSKQDLLYKLTAATASAMVDDLRRAGNIVGPPSDRLRAIVSSYVRCAARMHTTVYVATHEFEALGPDQRAVILALREEVNRILVSCLEAGREAGEFRFDDVRALRLAILTMCIAVSRWFSSDGPLTAEDLGAKYGELVLKMVKS